jgi:hypothetical protein
MYLCFINKSLLNLRQINISYPLLLPHHRLHVSIVAIDRGEADRALLEVGDRFNRRQAEICALGDPIEVVLARFTQAKGT